MVIFFAKITWPSNRCRVYPAKNNGYYCCCRLFAIYAICLLYCFLWARFLSRFLFRAISESNPGSVCTPWHFIITASLWEGGIISNPFLETRILGFWDLSHLPTCWSILVVNFEIRSLSVFERRYFQGGQLVFWVGIVVARASPYTLVAFFLIALVTRLSLMHVWVPVEEQDHPLSGEGRGGLLLKGWDF